MYRRQSLKSSAIVAGSYLLEQPECAALVEPSKDSSVDILDLQCEYLKTPLGLDVEKPRLSWRLHAKDKQARGQCQTRYQIYVASTQHLLLSDQPDLWSSGAVRSKESVNICYAGKPLKFAQECFWRVRVADESGHWSAWSEVAYWSMGPMTSSDWTALWIGAQNFTKKSAEDQPTDNKMSDPWLRKTFELPETWSARSFVPLDELV